MRLVKMQVSFHMSGRHLIHSLWLLLDTERNRNGEQQGQFLKSVAVDHNRHW